jgi:hypothetical protein
LSRSLPAPPPPPPLPSTDSLPGVWLVHAASVPYSGPHDGWRSG